MPEIIRVNREWMKRQIDSTRDSIGRNVTFYRSVNSTCSLCTASGYYNATLDTTVYYNCPVCAGKYYSTTLEANVVLARVHWTNDEALTLSPGGRYFVGDATVTVDPSYLELAEACQNESSKVVVDNHDMEILKIIPVGAPEPNRYRVVLKNNGERPS